MLADETLALARPPVLLALTEAFALVDVRFPPFERLRVALCESAVAPERLRTSFERTGFFFGLAASLPRFSVERVFAAVLRFRVAVETDVVFCFGAAVPVVFFVDFLRAAIGKLSTHDWLV